MPRGNKARTQEHLKQQAQNEIMDALVGRALHLEENNDTELAGKVRELSTQLALRWRIYCIPGLPDTFR